MSVEKAEAIKAIDPDAMCVIREDQIEWHTTPISDEVIAAKQAELKAEYDTQEYARNRKDEYPPIGDQLDALFHAGVFPADMDAQLQAVKDKYPK